MKAINILTCEMQSETQRLNVTKAVNASVDMLKTFNYAVL